MSRTSAQTLTSVREKFACKLSFFSTPAWRAASAIRILACAPRTYPRSWVT